MSRCWLCREADMRALVSEDVLRKYEKFKAMRSNANYR